MFQSVVLMFALASPFFSRIVMSSESRYIDYFKIIRSPKGMEEITFALAVSTFLSNNPDFAHT